MSEWWEKGYPGGPMVGPSFIRPLYPPDAVGRGKVPSAPGEDVIAIKRAVSRGGRWPWGTFDDSFSNGFSHGKGPNVRDSGLAGVQRQNNIDPTGWMGEGTYNLIRSARIPEGLPHAGEPLLDKPAIDLLVAYKKKYQGSFDTVRLGALARAQQFLGYRESPPGTNGNMFGAWYGINYEPWCLIFVSYCYETGSDGGSPSFAAGMRYSYVPTIVDDARAGRNGLSVTQDPMPGDVVAYDWHRNGLYDHAGIFQKWLTQDRFYAVEGNTSVSNDSNGGQVMQRERATSGSARITFIRVAEPG